MKTTPEKYSKLKREFDTESNELINRICDTFNDDLKTLANKYGVFVMTIEVMNEKKESGK
jgi:hypothetical protein